MLWSVVGGGAALGLLAFLAVSLTVSPYCCRRRRRGPPEQDFLEYDDEMKHMVEQHDMAIHQLLTSGEHEHDEWIDFNLATDFTFTKRTTSL